MATFAERFQQATHLAASPRGYNMDTISPIANDESKSPSANDQVEHIDAPAKKFSEIRRFSAEQESKVREENGFGSPEHMIRSDLDFTFVERRSSLGQLFDKKKVDVSVPEKHCYGTQEQMQEFAKLYKKACKGNKSAQCDLGVMYYYGSKGIMQSTRDALYWLKLSAVREYIPAQVNLGVICHLMEDMNEAKIWFERAAESGSDWGYYHLGIMYYSGEIPNVGVNYEYAFRCFKQAAKKGHSLSANNVGCMYLNGVGVQMNYKKALKWMRKLSTTCCYADFNLGIMYEEALGVSRSLSTADEHFRLAKTDFFNSSICPAVTDEQFDRKQGLMILSHNF